jgi:hypothetical protein
MRSFAFLMALFLILTIVFSCLTTVPGETARQLATGWLEFLRQSVARVTINWWAVATVALCAALILFGGHRFAVWLSSAWASPALNKADSPPAVEASPTRRGWPLRRTTLLLTIVVLMFVAGISFVGLVHQAVWLATAPEPLSQRRLDLDSVHNSAKLNLDGIGIGLHKLAWARRSAPLNGSWPAGRQASHSWLTRILPWLSISTANIDGGVDWSHPKNAPAFRRFVPQYLSPEFGALRESRGYAVSHYAGNVHFFEPRRSARESLRSRGATSIVCGEVAGDFMAWGDPANLRDPMRGINRSRDGFGNSDETGALFLMADGSTRFLSTNVDPSVLAALALPEPEERQAAP